MCDHSKNFQCLPDSSWVPEKQAWLFPNPSIGVSVFLFFSMQSINCCWHKHLWDASCAECSNLKVAAYQGVLDWHPAPKPVLEAAIEARQRAAKHGVDIGTLAIKHAVKADGVITLIGMRTPEEVHTGRAQSNRIMQRKSSPTHTRALSDVWQQCMHVSIIVSLYDTRCKVIWMLCLRSNVGAGVRGCCWICLKALSLVLSTGADGRPNCARGTGSGAEQCCRCRGSRHEGGHGCVEASHGRHVANGKP